MQQLLLDLGSFCVEQFRDTPTYILFIVILILSVAPWVALYIFFTLVAPRPRPPFPLEKLYTTIGKDGKVTEPLPLPCWQEDSIRRAKQKGGNKAGQPIDLDIDPPSVFLSVVVPAYNEQDRILGMLEEAVNYLEEEYGDATSSKRPLSPSLEGQAKLNGKPANGSSPASPSHSVGWEILIVSDGSTDATLETVHNFTSSHLLPQRPRRQSGPWTHRSPQSVNIPPSSIRVISLSHNRGKGGAVTHGLRHVRGAYTVFADADGASNFPDLGSLVSAAQRVEDSRGRAVAVGSRAHLVGSEAVVKRSKLRNFLMHSFHTLLKLLTPPRTARIRDTQCGFKLFSRSALPDIVPYMHSEGWIFDVEMLMLAEGANVPVVEVPIGWREVGGSKLNVLRDSAGMAWGLAVLRICWMVGIYRRGVLSDEGEERMEGKKDI